MKAFRSTKNSTSYFWLPNTLCEDFEARTLELRGARLASAKPFSDGRQPHYLLFTYVCNAPATDHSSS